MFSQESSFDAMLYHVSDDLLLRRLSTALRLWVNCLRGGIYVDEGIVAQLCSCIAACGWQAAVNGEQQDPAELFTFLAEKLSLPSLVVSITFAHGGQANEAEDHKLGSERLLHVPIPDGMGTVTLDDCLQAYFSNFVKVKRRVFRSFSGSKDMISQHVERKYSKQDSLANNKHQGVRERNISLPSHKSVYYNSKTLDPHTNDAVIPAWQFFQILPFYADNDNGNREVSDLFRLKTPILGICLKRYGIDAKGNAYKKNTPVLIPNIINLPSFIASDETSSQSANRKYRQLQLHSAVCHRGYSVNSGHYIALAESPHGNGSWLHFDDLKPHSCVTEGHPADLFSNEMPYIVFYRLEQELENHKFLAPPNHSQMIAPLDTSSEDMAEDVNFNQQSPPSMLTESASEKLRLKEQENFMDAKDNSLVSQADPENHHMIYDWKSSDLKAKPPQVSEVESDFVPVAIQKAASPQEPTRPAPAPPLHKANEFTPDKYPLKLDNKKFSSSPMLVGDRGIYENVIGDSLVSPIPEDCDWENKTKSAGELAKVKSKKKKGCIVQ